MTTGALIDKYIEIRDYVQAKQKELDGHLKVYKDGMASIETEVLERLNKDGAQSAKAQSGAIAFRQLATHMRVINREEWINWLEENWHIGKDMLTAHVTKDVVKNYIDGQPGTPIPKGLEVTQVWGVNFRRG